MIELVAFWTCLSLSWAFAFVMLIATSATIFSRACFLFLAFTLFMVRFSVAMVCNCACDISSVWAIEMAFYRFRSELSLMRFFLWRMAANHNSVSSHFIGVSITISCSKESPNCCTLKWNLHVAGAYQMDHLMGSCTWQTPCSICASLRFQILCIGNVFHTVGRSLFVQSIFGTKFHLMSSPQVWRRFLHITVVAQLRVSFIVWRNSLYFRTPCYVLYHTTAKLNSIPACLGYFHDIHDSKYDKVQTPL